MNVGYKKIARADFEIVTTTPIPPPSLPQWSTYQGNAAHTGYVPVFLDTGNFKEAWIWPDDGTELVPLNPVAAGDGKVFVTAGGDYGQQLAMALDSTNGDTVWTYDFGESGPTDPIFILPPAFANGRVYIQSAGPNDPFGYNPSFLWVLDANSGEVLFDPAPYDNQGARYYAPTIYEGNVYVGGGYGGAYGFDGTGEELWYVDWNSPYKKWTPAVNENYAIAYSGPYAKQLTVIHRSEIPDGLTDRIAFTIADDAFYFDTFNMNLAPVLGSENNVIVINGGRLISFDLTKQKIGWEIPKNEGDLGSFSGQPSLANGIIYAVAEGYLHALDESDGSSIEGWLPWQPPEGESIVTPMIVTGNLIFVSTEIATYAVDLESQTDVWSYPAGGHLALNEDGVLFIATTEGILYAIFTIAVEEF